MTWLLWLGFGLLALLVAAIGLTAYGERRWAGEIATLQTQLEAGRLDGKPAETTPPTRYDARELVGLRS